MYKLYARHTPVAALTDDGGQVTAMYRTEATHLLGISRGPSRPIAVLDARNMMCDGHGEGPHRARAPPGEKTHLHDMAKAQEVVQGLLASSYSWRWERQQQTSKLPSQRP